MNVEFNLQLGKFKITNNFALILAGKSSISSFIQTVKLQQEAFVSSGEPYESYFSTNLFSDFIIVTRSYFL